MAHKYATHPNFSFTCVKSFQISKEDSRPCCQKFQQVHIHRQSPAARARRAVHIATICNANVIAIRDVEEELLRERRRADSVSAHHNKILQRRQQP